MTNEDVMKIAKADIKKNGSYVIPKSHPDNELSTKQKMQFSEEMAVARKLVKAKVLRIIQDDRRITAFEFV